jgi:hypothetical protein
MQTIRIALAVLCCTGGLLAEPGARTAWADTLHAVYDPQMHPVLTVLRAAGPITVDGDLSDPGWQGAPAARHFSEHSPGEEVQPPVRTEAFVTYDDEHLYIAAVCYADPKAIPASFCEREQIFNDDNIGFFFDTYGDATRAYIINLNPYGIPYDALWSPGWGEDSNFDILFESAGQITDSGYQVEAAIPFRSLRFPDRPEQEWRFDFWRHHLRDVHHSMSWARYDRDESCWPCQWGTIKGIRDVSPGRGVEFIGSLVATQFGSVQDDVYPRETFDNGDLKGEPSIGCHYALSSDVVLEGTYNPDFSQIEADASQIDVNTTFALSYPERRPFFQEGIDAFRTNFNVVYTRSINDPDFAVKGSAKLGRTSISLLSSHDEHSPVIVPFEEQSEFVAMGGSYTNMFAVRRSFGQDNHVRLVSTDRRFEGGGSGTLGSLDGALRLGKSVKLRGQFILTHTEEPDRPDLTEDFDSVYFDRGAHTTAFDGESFSGSAALVGINYDGRRALFDLVTYQRTPTYRADNGIQPRNGDRWVSGQAYYHLRPRGKVIAEIQPGIEYTRIYDFDGVRKDHWLELQTWTSFNMAQTQFGVEYSFSQERFGGIYFDKIWVFATEFNTRPWNAVGFGGAWAYGRTIARDDLAMGMQTVLNSWVDFRPLKRLQGELRLNYTRSRDVDTFAEYFDGYIARLRMSYQFTRRFSLRLVGEYDAFDKQWSLDPLVTYQINPFSTFYAGAAYDYLRFDGCGTKQDETVSCLSQRQFFVKIQYLLQT